MRPELSARLGYAETGLDRLAEHRDDKARMAELAGSPLARALVIAGDIPLLRQTGGELDPLFRMDEPAGFGSVRETTFLGVDGDAPVFGIQLDARTPDDQSGDALVSIDLRTLATRGMLPPATLGRLGQAKSLLYWHQRHRFCAHCGQPTTSSAAGWRRECASCGAQHFPRTDPVAIMLAVRGDKCVLGRSGRFAATMYSCLAGFIEPGETIEDAVRRELFEESGVHISRVRYLASQPWPFPASLMIGCLAHSTTEELVVDHNELEDARWFTRDEVRAMVEQRHPDGLTCPPPIAIAHSLMRAWAVDGEEP